jgi:hypothetical protein
MTLGGSPALSNLVFAENTQQTYYVVNMLDFQVNGVSIGVNASIYNSAQAVVDSGTTGASHFLGILWCACAHCVVYPEFLLPDVAFNKTRSVFQSLCSSTPLNGVCGQPAGQTIFDGNCFQLSAVRG